MAATDECCAVCAEPLKFVAIARCGHAESCSKCALRLRAVLDDERCVICQQPGDCVFVTRSAGELTSAPRAEAFDGFKAQAKQGKLWLLDRAQAFFDDKAEFERMKSLLAFTHPALSRSLSATAVAAGGDGNGEEEDEEEDDEEFEGGKAMPRGGGGNRASNSSFSRPSPSSSSRFSAPAGPTSTFPTMKDLKAALSKKGLSFCDVCLKGRKVFACEQLVYTRRSLARHKAAGDAAGPLAESGFSGHPRCDFCSQRFYGETELFLHMQTRHEHCFLCRRVRPTEYTYFRDYEDLDAHFARSHHRCPHPDCLEKKFVVFASDSELRAHALKEHGGNLSKAERRAAATIQIDYGERERGGGGGGAGVSSSSSSSGLGAAAGRRGGRGGGRDTNNGPPSSSSSAPAPAPAAPEPSSPRLRPEDFPAALGGSSSSSMLSGGRGTARWSGAVGGGASSGGGVGGRGAASFTSTENFPALSAARPPPAAAPVPPRPQIRRPAGGAPPAAPLSREVLYPPLPRAPPPPPPPQAVAAAAARPRTLPPATAPSAQTLDEAFPALRVSAPPAAAPRPLPPPPYGALRAAAAAEAPPPSRGRAPAPLPPAAAAALQQSRQGEEFPSLGAAAGAPSPPSSSSSSSSSAAARPPPKVSAALREANRALNARVKAALKGDDLAADSFRALAARYARGEAAASAVAAAVAKLGLSALLPDMAALLPHAEAREALLEAAADLASRAKPGEPGWAPPEAVAEMRKKAGSKEKEKEKEKQQASAAAGGAWPCARCTLVNAPSAVVCEVCGALRSKQQQRKNEGGGTGPSTSTTPSSSSSSQQQQQQNGNSGKEKKKSKFERVRLTSGDARATEAFLVESGAVVRPGNVWTQRR